MDNKSKIYQFSSRTPHKRAVSLEFDTPNPTKIQFEEPKDQPESIFSEKSKYFFISQVIRKKFMHKNSLKIGLINSRRKNEIFIHRHDSFRNLGQKITTQINDQEQMMDLRQNSNIPLKIKKVGKIFEQIYKKFIQQLAMKKYNQCQISIQGMDEKARQFAMKLLQQIKQTEMENLDLNKKNTEAKLTIKQKDQLIDDLNKKNNQARLIRGKKDKQIDALNLKIEQLEYNLEELDKRNQQLMRYIQDQKPHKLVRQWNQILLQLKRLFKQGQNEDIMQLKELIGSYKILCFSNQQKTIYRQSEQIPSQISEIQRLDYSEFAKIERSQVEPQFNLNRSTFI